MIKPNKNAKTESTPSPCNSKRILQAISILKQINEKFCETKQKKSLLEDESENPIILQLTMKKIPPLKMQKFIKVHLPKSFLNDKKEVCLITGDLDKRNTKAEVEPDVLHFKELLKKENISEVNEVITLRQLRKEYKPFEARRQLCGAYDVFLCDKRIAGVLPHTLGKCFFKKRRLPIQINMQTRNLKEQIENALSSTIFHITCKGNTCASEVANLSMNEEEILSNIMSSIEALKEELPGQWANILGIYVKTPKSKAIPLYMCNDDPNEFKFPWKRKRTKFVAAELSTMDNSRVKVFRDGRVVLQTSKEDEDSDSSSEIVEEASSNEQIEQSEETPREASPLPDEEVENDTDVVKKPKKRSKKSSSNIQIEQSEVISSESNSLPDEEVDNNDTDVVKKRKKRSKKSSFNDQKEQSEETPTESSLLLDEEIDNNDTDVVKKPKKRSKKPSSNNQIEQREVISGESSSLPDEEVDNNDTDVVKKPKKRSKKSSSNNQIEQIEIISREPKKRSKKPSSNDQIEQSEETPRESSSLPDDEVEDNTDIVKKHKKRSKKQKSHLSSTDKISTVEVNEEEVENSEIEKPERKRKKRKTASSNNQIEQSKETPRESSPLPDEEVENDRDVVKKPKKKSKKRKSDLRSTEKISKVEVNEEEVENFEIEKPERIHKKRKCGMESSKEGTKVELTKENNGNSVKSRTRKYKKKTKN